MLKRRIKALEEVEAQFRTAYEKHADGTFRLKLDDDDGGDDDGDDGGKSAAELRLKEFRKTNARLQKQLDELNAKFGGIDVDGYQNAMKYVEQARSEEERALLKAGRFDDVLTARQAKMKETYEKQLADERKKAADLEKTATGYKQMLHGDRVRAKLRAAADEMKLRLNGAGAVEDFYARGLRAFQELDEAGNLVALEGEDIKLNREHKPYSAKDFIMELVETAPHLIEGASGADLKGGTRGRGRSSGGVIEIDGSDKNALEANIENIATGKMRVRVQ